MEFEHEKRQARRILSGIEDGTLRTGEIRSLVDAADPALVYFIFTWIRSRYPAHHPAFDGVIGRVAELCNTYPSVARKIKEGESDSIVEWFEDAYAYRDFKATEFIALIVDKLES